MLAVDAVVLAERVGDRVALGAVAVQGVAVLLSLSRGAMAALLLVAPIGLMLAWARDGEARGRLWLRRVLVFAGFAALCAVAFAWLNLSRWRDLGGQAALSAGP